MKKILIVVILVSLSGAGGYLLGLRSGLVATTHEIERKIPGPLGVRLGTLNMRYRMALLKHGISAEAEGIYAAPSNAPPPLALGSVFESKPTSLATDPKTPTSEPSPGKGAK